MSSVLKKGKESLEVLFIYSLVLVFRRGFGGDVGCDGFFHEIV